MLKVRDPLSERVRTRQARAAWVQSIAAIADEMIGRAQR